MSLLSTLRSLLLSPRSTQLSLDNRVVCFALETNRRIRACPPTTPPPKHPPEISAKLSELVQTHVAMAVQDVNSWSNEQVSEYVEAQLIEAVRHAVDQQRTGAAPMPPLLAESVAAARDKPLSFFPPVAPAELTAEAQARALDGGRRNRWDRGDGYRATPIPLPHATLPAALVGAGPTPDSLYPSLSLSPSTIGHAEAGAGVHVASGILLPGTVVALYPGTLYPSTFFHPSAARLPPSSSDSARATSLSATDVLGGNDYLWARPDGWVLDGRGWSARLERLLTHAALSGASVPFKFRNPLAVGNYINHPPPGGTPNVAAVPISVPRSDPLARLLPHEESTLSLVESSAFAEASDVLHSLAIVTIHPVPANTELFLNYRFNPALSDTWPDWYTDPDPEASARRWGKRGLLGF